MKTIEIPRPLWGEFLANFRRQYESWLVQLQIIGAEIGAQTEASEVPLVDISAQPTSAAGLDQITIEVGTPPNKLTHIVHDPTHLRVEQSDDGTDAALQIEARHEPMTLLRFASQPG